MRHLPWVILVNVVAAILTMLVVSAAVHSGFARFGVADFRIFYTPIPLSTVIAFVAGAVVFGVMTRNRRIMTFTDEVVGELIKVSWPTRDETLRASVTVVGTTAFTASLLALYDLLWKNVADYVFFNPTVSRYIVGFFA